MVRLGVGGGDGVHKLSDLGGRNDDISKEKYMDWIGEQGQIMAEQSPNMGAEKDIINFSGVAGLQNSNRLVNEALEDIWIFDRILVIGT